MFSLFGVATASNATLFSTSDVRPHCIEVSIPQQDVDTAITFDLSLKIGDCSMAEAPGCHTQCYVVPAGTAPLKVSGVGTVIGKLFDLARGLAVSAAPRHRIGFYVGGGAAGVGALHRMITASATSLYGAAGFSLHNLSAAVMGKVNRTEYDVLVFPGGSGTGQSDALGSKGRAAVVAFVRAGGGYIGTCGGAFLGLQHLKFYGDPPPHAIGYPEACHAHGCARRLWPRLFLSACPHTVFALGLAAGAT